MILEKKMLIKKVREGEGSYQLHQTIVLQDLTEDNRNLRRLVTRQEKELGRFTKTEADLPVILRAHNEESRVLKMKIRQSQDSNKKLSVNIKKKDQQLLGLLEENKQLKKINSLEMKDETYILEEKLKDVTRLLDSRDNEFKVSFTGREG